MIYFKIIDFNVGKIIEIFLYFSFMILICKIIVKFFFCLLLIIIYIYDLESVKILNKNLYDVFIMEILLINLSWIKVYCKLI